MAEAGLALCVEILLPDWNSFCDVVRLYQELQSNVCLL